MKILTSLGVVKQIIGFMKFGVSRASSLIPSEKGLVIKMLAFKSLYYQLNDSLIRLLYMQHKNFKLPYLFD